MRYYTVLLRRPRDHNKSSRFVNHCWEKKEVTVEKYSILDIVHWVRLMIDLCVFYQPSYHPFSVNTNKRSVSEVHLRKLDVDGVLHRCGIVNLITNQTSL